MQPRLDEPCVAGGREPEPAFYGSDPMGLAASVALGVAIARAPRRVLFLAGDGDLLMSLTALVAMAGAPDVSLGVVVFANGRYETGGAQSLPGGARTDLATLAAGAGVRVLPDAPGDAEEAASMIDALFAVPGAALCVMPVSVEASPYGGPGALSGAEERRRFQDALARHDSAHAAAPSPEASR